MKLLIVLALFIAGARAQSCALEFAPFAECVADKSAKVLEGFPNRPDPEAMRNMVDSCVTENGCVIPEEAEEGRGRGRGFRGLIPEEVDREQLKETMHKCKQRAMEEALRPAIQTCMSGKIPGFQLPDIDPETLEALHGHRRGRGRHFGHGRGHKRGGRGGRRRGGKRGMRKLQRVLSGVHEHCPGQEENIKKCLYSRSQELFSECRNPVQMGLLFLEKKEAKCQAYTECKETHLSSESCLEEVKSAMCECASELVGAEEEGRQRGGRGERRQGGHDGERRRGGQGGGRRRGGQGGGRRRRGGRVKRASRDGRGGRRGGRRGLSVEPSEELQAAADVFQECVKELPAIGGGEGGPGMLVMQKVRKMVQGDFCRHGGLRNPCKFGRGDEEEEEGEDLDLPAFSRRPSASGRRGPRNFFRNFRLP